MAVRGGTRSDIGLILFVESIFPIA